MERRINKKLSDHFSKVKDEIRDKINILDFADKVKVNELLEFLYEFPRFQLNKDDLIKRKRIKNSIPVLDRCNAKRACGDQCTRRRFEGSEFCGTHAKGTPHGLITQLDNAQQSVQKIEVFAEDICGIVYYIDNIGNVYKTEDILDGRQNPTIVARYVKCQGVYSIPELNI